MPRSPFKPVLAIAGSLSVMLLAGCPNAGTAPPLPGTTTPPAGQTPAPGQTGGSNATPAPGQTGGSSPTTAPVESPSSLEATTVRGKVYDEEGAVVSDAKVRIRSLSSAQPFDTTVDVTGGAYVANNVPSGVNLEISVSKANWTSRSRVEALIPLGTSTTGNIVNFGGTNTTEDAEGPAYFISNYPEVLSATVTDATRAHEKAEVTVTFSEPFDQTNRNRLERALEIEVPGGSTITRNSTFLNASETAAVSWNEDNTAMTLSFNAPLRANEDDDSTYYVRFVRAIGADVIKDTDGKDLGYNAPAAGNTYDEVFKLGDLTIGDATTGQARWAATHQAQTSFSVTKDEKEPVLTGVTTADVTIGGTLFTRFSLAFDEPMQVFPTFTGTGLTTVSNYVFALGKTNNDLDGVDMDPSTLLNVNTLGDAQNALTAEDPFVFTNAQATVAASTSDPKVIWFSVPKSIIPTDADKVKVRVRNVEDPAGNVVSDDNENAEDQTADNVKIGDL